MTKPSLCQCADWPSALHGRCIVVCGAEIPAKHTICRPCALGNHSGQACEEYVRGPIWHLDKSCARCGFDSAAHVSGRD